MIADVPLPIANLLRPFGDQKNWQSEIENRQ